MSETATAEIAPEARVDTGRAPAALIFAGSAALLMGALLFQYWGGLPPCPLCILQRYFHIAVVVIGATAFLAPDPRWRMGLLGLGALALLGSAAMAFFHVGVEAKWWEGLSGCAGDTLGARPVDPTQLIKGAEQGPAVRCDEVPWSFLGLSLAGWNVVASLVMAGIAAYGAFRLATRRT